MTTPGPYDGYVSETQRGYEVSANGVLIDTVPDLGTAKVLVGEHSQGKPRWLVSRSGATTRLD